MSKQYKNPTLMTNNWFSVTLPLDGSEDPHDGDFRECSGLEFTQDVIQFREVTNQRWGNATKGCSRLAKIPGNLTNGNLILRRGMTDSKAFWLWFSSVHGGHWFKQRKVITVTLYNQGIPRVSFKFREAWPVSYRAGEVNVDSSELKIHELEIACERFEQVPV